MSRLQKEKRMSSSSRTSSDDTRTSSFIEYVYRKRIILSILAVLIAIGMVIGLLFVAHYYYHMWGGQGFLRTRTLDEVLDELFFAQNGSGDGMAPCLPMRKTNEFDNAFLDHDPELRRQILAAAPPNNSLPFFVCGDQAQDCEAYGQPNICCPVNFLCHSTSKKITASGIFCCHFNSSSADCRATKSHKPQCLAGSFECPSFTGGGCCPAGAQCLNQTTTTTTVTSTYPFATQTKTIGGGCALYIGNSGGQLLTTTTTRTSTLSSTTHTTWSPDYSNIIEQSTTSSISTHDPDAPTKTGGPAGGSTTATFIGGATGTTVREGEIALKGAGAPVVLRSTSKWGFLNLIFSRSPASMGIWLVLIGAAFFCL